MSGVRSCADKYPDSEVREIAQHTPMRTSGSGALALGFLLWMLLGGDGRTQSFVIGEPESLAAWASIFGVLRHPRCLNCHQLDTPLQGDTRRIHVPPVIRGADSKGAGTMRCHNCHNESGNNRLSGVPGAARWQFAPASMLWQGLSSGELCRMIKDPARNGNRMPEALVTHMGDDPLVLWGWAPGDRRAPVPMPHAVFIERVKNWLAGGAACPH
jgi:hypothetical protein